MERQRDSMTLEIRKLNIPVWKRYERETTKQIFRF